MNPLACAGLVGLVGVGLLGAAGCSSGLPDEGDSGVGASDSAILDGARADGKATERTGMDSSTHEGSTMDKDSPIDTDSMTASDAAGGSDSATSSDSTTPSDSAPGSDATTDKDSAIDMDSMTASDSASGSDSTTASDSAPEAMVGVNDGSAGGDGGDVGADTGDEAVSGCGTRTLCGATCVDTTSDKFNCGGCGNECVVQCIARQCDDPIALSASYQDSCALLSGGTVACWGQNGSGQLGTGTTSDAWAPAIISGLSGVTSVAAGTLHSCAILSDGTVRCWGENAAGELGNGTTKNSPTPVAVAGLSGAMAVAVGDYNSLIGCHSCAALSDGTVQCWGTNISGELGNGTTSTPAVGTLVNVSGVSGATAVIAGNGYSCALLSDGSVKCWGGGAVGQNSATPSVVPGLNGGVAMVAGGQDQACALFPDGTAKCWGYNGSGQLGNGTKIDSSTAVTVSGLSGATSIAAAFSNNGTDGDTCAVLAGGTVQCWGDNSYGQLGNGTTTTPDAGTTALVSGLSSATAVIAGEGYACALLSNHSVQCWGNNGNGELGNGTTTNSLTPVPVTW